MRRKGKIGIGIAAAILAGSILSGCNLGEKSYTVTLSGAVGLESNTLSVDWGKTPDLPESMTQEGYSFEGWYTDAKFTTPYTGSAIESDTTLYAKWVANTYVLSYSSGVEGLTFEPKSVAYGSELIFPATDSVIRDYYSFVSWCKDAELTQPVSAGDKMPASNLTLYAKWNENVLKIKFDGNGATEGTMRDLTIKETDESKALSQNLFRREGYEFKGWATSKNGEVVYTDKQAFQHVESSGEMTLYAVWAIRKVQVEYMSLSTTGSIQSFKLGELQDYGSNVTTISEEPSIPGFTFKGWGHLVATSDTTLNKAKVYYNANGTLFIGEKLSSDLYEVNDVSAEVAKDNTKLYARFERVETTVTFYVVEEGKSPAEISHVTGYYDFSFELPEFEKEIGYDYSAGVYGNSDCSGNQVTTLKFGTTNLSLYFKKVHHIYTFTNSSTKQTQELFYGATVQNPSIVGKIFVGWKVEDADPVLNLTMPASDLTAEPVFVDKEYTVVFHNASISNKTYKYGDSLDLNSMPNPTKPGYTFAGYFYDELFKNQVLTDAKMGDIEGNLHIYVKFVAREFELKFDKGDGTFLASKNVAYNALIKDVLPEENPTKQGYEFRCWIFSGDFISDELSMETSGLSVDQLAANGMTLTALWNEALVDVTINYLGEKLDGTGYEQIKESSAAQVYTGYSYGGNDVNWPEIENYELDYAERVVALADGSAQLNVYYNLVRHEVSLVDNDGVSISFNVKHGAKLGNLPQAIIDKNPGRIEIYINGDKVTFSDYANMICTSDMKIDIVFVEIHSVTFDLDGGNVAGGMAESVEFDVDSEVDVSLFAEPEKEGHTFAGWSVKEGGVTIIDNKFTMPVNSVALKANWTVNQYNVTFTSEKGNAPAALVMNYGSDIVLANYPINITGYTLTGYSVGGVNHPLTDTIKVPAANIELVAQFAVNTTVITFDGNGGDIPLDAETTQTLTFESASKALNANPFVKPGYHFVGWSEVVDGDVVYEDEAEFTEFNALNGTKTLHAVWEVNSITLSFDSNGGSLVSPIVADYRSLIDAPNRPERPGYVFTGWFIDKDAYDGGAVSLEYMDFQEDTTLYAHWTLANYQVIFNSNGGTSVDPVTVLHQSKLEEAPANPTRTGYTFKGWYLTDAEGNLTTQVISETGVILDEDLVTINANDIKLTARWERISHDVNYYSGGSKIGTSTYGYGETIAKPADPVGNPGEIFIGWLDAENNFFDFATQGIMKDQEINLYACFVTEKFDIVFKNENGEEIFRISSDATDPTFAAYIQQLLNEKDGYELIFNAIQDAVKAVATEGKEGSADEITAYIAYATIAPNPRQTAIIMGGGTPEQYAQLSQGFAAYGTNEAKQTILTIAQLAQTDPATLASMLPTLAGDSNPLVAQLAAQIIAAAGDPGLTSAAITPYALFAMDDATALQMILSTAGISNENIAKVFALEAKLPYATHSEYYNLLASNGAGGMENSAAYTGDRLTTTANLYAQYEANAYTPISSDPNKIFDGWAESLSLDKTVKTMEPIFVEKAQPVVNLGVHSTTNSSVTFVWDKVDGAYGYRVSITKNGTLIETEVVVQPTSGLTVQYKVNGLLRNDNVSIDVVALTKDENGEYRAMSQQFTATSLVSGSAITKEAIALDSDPTSITYIHTADNEIGQVSKVADYYYVTEEGMYIFFSNTTYHFSSGTVLTITKGSDIATVQDGNTLIVGNMTGELEIQSSKSGENKTIKAQVRAIPQRISSTSAFAQTESVKFNSSANAFNVATDTFIGERETYKVGVATSAMVEGSSYNDPVNAHYNGFRFDIQTVSVSGTSIYMDHDFKFMKKVGNEYVDVDSSTFKYSFDAASETFYFDSTNELGEYKAIITQKADDTANGYINSYIPDALKGKLDTSKFTKEVYFELVQGLNVYTRADLKRAMANPSVTVINIHNNIEAKYSADGIAYVEYVKNSSAFMGEDKDHNPILKTGECDIVDYSATMTTDATYGPKIWVESNSNVVFHDVNGQGYAYSATGGTKAIKDADFVQNFDNGAFKIASETNANNNINGNGYSAKGYKGAACFARYGSSNQPLTINGNYFTVDASKTLKVKSANKVSVGGSLAAYEIQSVHLSVFENSGNSSLTINGLNIIGNTQNESALLDAATDSKEIMKMTSGGISGLYSRAPVTYNDSLSASNKAHLNQVNMTNILIGAYMDEGGSVTNCHISNAWANGIYGWSTRGQYVNVSNSFIENCGGCAFDFDAQDNSNNVNKKVPAIRMDISTTRIENYVSGDEQWFKAYTMETVALGLKSTIESQVSAMNYTILKTIHNDVTGLDSHCMNWVFFSKCDAVDSTVSAGTVNTNTIGCEMHFGDDCVYSGQQDPNTGAYVYVDPTTATPKVAIMDVGGTVLDLTPFVGKPTVQLGSNGNNTVIVDLVSGRTYLLFRMEQSGMGWVQGMVELFAK